MIAAVLACIFSIINVGVENVDATKITKFSTRSRRSLARSHLVPLKLVKKQTQTQANTMDSNAKSNSTSSSSSLLVNTNYKTLMQTGCEPKCRWSCKGADRTCDMSCGLSHEKIAGTWERRDIKMV